MDVAESASRWMCCFSGNPQVSRASAALSSAGVRLWFTGGTARPLLLGWESPSAGRPSGSVAPMATAIVETPVATCSNCARQQARSMSCACTVTEISGQPVQVRAVSGTPRCRSTVPTPTRNSFSGLYLGLMFAPLPGGGVPCCRRQLLFVRALRVLLH